MSNFLFEGLLGPLFIATLLLAALLKILSFTESMAGKFGSMASEYAGKALGVGVAVASGGASLAIGGSASALLKGGMGEKLREKAKEGGVFGKMASGTVLMADKAQKGSWDVRNIGGKDSMFGATVGGYLGQGVGSLGIGKGGNKGGYQKKDATREAAATKKDNERAELFEMSKGEEAKIKEEMTGTEREAHEDATKTVDTLEDLIDLEKRELKEAEGKMKDTAFGQRVDSATTNVASKETSLNKAKADLEKIKNSPVADQAMISIAESEVNKQDKALQEAKREMRAAQEVPEMAEIKKTKESIAVNEKKLTDAKTTFTQTKTALAAAEGTAKEKINKENSKRRGAYAQRSGEKASSLKNVGKVVGGAVLGGAMAGPLGMVAGGVAGYAGGTKESNKERVRKIRKGRSEDERNEGKKLKALLKAMEEVKKESGDGKEEGKKEEKEEKKEEEKH